jgi:FkbM family methyltransferase
MIRKLARKALEATAPGLIGPAEKFDTAFLRSHAWKIRFKTTADCIERTRIHLQMMTARRPRLQDATLLISAAEVSRSHGTGILLYLMLRGQPSLINVRSRNYYKDNLIGAPQLRYPNELLDRSRIYFHLSRFLKGTTISEIVCVPFYPDDLRTAVAAADITAAPMALYIMDDQNLHADGIPDPLIKEAIQKSAVCFAISEPLRAGYEKKYGRKFWLLPPVAPDEFFAGSELIPANNNPPRGVLIGNIWEQSYLDNLRKTVRDSGLKIDWYGNDGKPRLKYDDVELEKDGIKRFSPLEDEPLVRTLRKYDYTVIPTSILDGKGEKDWLARGSLPSRLIYTLSTALLPTVVLGDPGTAAAKFVRGKDLGTNCEYSGKAFVEAVQRVVNPKWSSAFRNRARDLIPVFRSSTLLDWLRLSIATRRAADDRFEKAFESLRDPLAPYIPPDSPADAPLEFLPFIDILDRIAARGYRPDFVVDVGASTGCWSKLAKRFFPDARYWLVDPLIEEYKRIDSSTFSANPTFNVVASAISDHQGSLKLNVSDDLYGSTLMDASMVPDNRGFQTITVPVTTLDELARAHSIAGHGILKIDVQFAEHLVLSGARELLPRADFIFIELSLKKFSPEFKTFDEILRDLTECGFRYYDHAGGWRDPVTGELLQQDAVFIRGDFEA